MLLGGIVWLLLLNFSISATYEYSFVGYVVDSKLATIQTFQYLPHMNIVAWKERVSVENFCA